jgi:hypothetical protein
LIYPLKQCPPVIADACHPLSIADDLLPPAAREYLTELCISPEYQHDGIYRK